jgi:hypothetical protein
MIQIRRNVFETNSSSSHSITIANDNLVDNEIPIVEDWDICNGEPTILVELNGFCGWCDHDTQMEKLAYVIMQIAYILDLQYANGWYGSKEEIEEAREKLYEADEFKELEDLICEHAGCKHVRLKEGTEGYIDHDSVCSNIEELKNWDIPYGGYLALIYGADTNIHFEFCG